MKYEATLTGEKIKYERKKRGWTQSKLAKKINISDNQISKYERGDVFPPLDSLFKLCEIFECELGYLLCEDDYSIGTKFETEVSKITGLNKKAIESLKRLTSSSKRAPFFGCESERVKNILNAILSSDNFSLLVQSFIYLDDCYQKVDSVYAEFLSLPLEVQTEASSLYASTEDWQYYPDSSISEDIINACYLLDKANDEMHSLSLKQKLPRYDVVDTFQDLLNEIYPKSKFTI